MSASNKLLLGAGALLMAGGVVFTLVPGASMSAFLSSADPGDVVPETPMPDEPHVVDDPTATPTPTPTAEDTPPTDPTATPTAQPPPDDDDGEDDGDGAEDEEGDDDDADDDADDDDEAEDEDDDDDHDRGRSDEAPGRGP